MKTILGAVAAVALTAGLAWAAVKSQEPKMPTPGPEHAFLKQFVGEWDSATKFRMGADQAWMESKGTESNRLLGGFWLVSEWKGDMMGQAFQGLGNTGYDPTKKKYVGTWIDSMMPYLSSGEGSVDASGKTLTMTITSTDCETEKPCTMRMVQTVKDANTVVWSMHMTGKDGKEFECMSGTSTRKK